jgi:pimeloyl-ACP methyl ester carboxylesterase
MVFIHGLACHREFWSPQMRHFALRHRVLAPDLRGHGQSDAPRQRYTMQSFADDIGWMCDQLGYERPVLIGHSLGGLVAMEAAASGPGRFAAVALVDSVLLAPGDRAGFVDRLVASLRTPDAERTLREYYGTFFGPFDEPDLETWILDEVVRTPPYVSSSVWEEAMASWSDEEALRRCAAPMLYLDAGTPNADLGRIAEIQPGLVLGRTIGSGHFSPLMVPDQVNTMIERFLAVGLRQRST